MSSRWTTLLPLGLAGCLAVGGVAAMVAGPGRAEPVPSAYATTAATASGDLWHLDTLDLDFSGQPRSVDLSVLHVAGALSPTRSGSDTRTQALAENLAGATAENEQARRGVGSSATRRSDTRQPAVGIAPAGSIDKTLDVAQTSLGARSRWVGDKGCLTTADGLTDGTASGGAATLAGSTIPAGGSGGLVLLPTDLPSTIPTQLPSPTSTGLPTSLPTVLPTDPATILPTDSPTTTSVPLPTLTALPTDLPTLPTPTITLPGLAPGAGAAAADQTVPLAAVATGTVQQRVDLPTRNGAKRDARGVRAQAVGTVRDTNAPAMTFFGGEVEVRVNGPARLTAYADGVHPGVVDWAPPVVTVRIPSTGEQYALPSSGSPIVVQYSRNSDVTLTLSTGALTDTVTTSQYAAGARAAVMHLRVADGNDVALEGDLMPLQAEAHAPDGGVVCPAPDTDHDGLSDALEHKLGTKPGVADTDRDGLKDGAEHFKYKTNPRRADTDRDRLKDGAEVRKYRTNPRKKDTDRDHLTDGQEVRRWHTNPRRKDTDHDGVNDGAEVRHHTNPLHK